MTEGAYPAVHPSTQSLRANGCYASLHKGVALLRHSVPHSLIPTRGRNPKTRLCESALICVTRSWIPAFAGMTRGGRPSVIPSAPPHVILSGGTERRIYRRIPPLELTFHRHRAFLLVIGRSRTPFCARPYSGINDVFSASIREEGAGHERNHDELSWTDLLGAHRGCIRGSGRAGITVI